MSDVQPTATSFNSTPPTFLTLPVELQLQIFVYLQPPISLRSSRLSALVFWPQRPRLNGKIPHLPALLILSAVCRYFQTIIFQSLLYRDLEWVRLLWKVGTPKRRGLDDFYELMTNNKRRMALMQTLLLDSFALAKDSLTCIFRRANPETITTVNLLIGHQPELSDDAAIHLLSPLTNLQNLKLLLSCQTPERMLSAGAFGYLSTSQLRKFTLKWMGPSITEIGVPALFCSNPNLREVDLQHTNPPQLDHGTIPFDLTALSSSAPHLHSLKIVTPSSLTGSLTHFTSLRNLHLIGGATEKWKIISSLPPSTRTNLTKLVIDVAPFPTHSITSLFADHENFVQTLSTFTSLTALTIDAKAGAWPAKLLRAISTRCTKLESLHIALDGEDYNREDYAHLLGELKTLQQLHVFVVQRQAMDADWGEFAVDGREEMRLLRRIRMECEVNFQKR